MPGPETGYWQPATGDCCVIELPHALLPRHRRGGTKTTCAVADESSVLATVTAGPSNVVRVGEATARESLQQAVRQACAAAGITLQNISRTCVGASGAARPAVASIVSRALAEILTSPIDVTGDIEIAHEAAFSGGPGVIVNAGTGSFAYGRDAQGNTARAGGWGFAVSDEGSAHWIGRTAIATLLRDRVVESGRHANRTDSALLHALLKAWDIPSIDHLIRAANATPPPDFSALFPVVLASADAGDSVARQVLTMAGSELAEIADTVIRRLFFHTTPAFETAPESAIADAPVPLAMVGGVFRHAAQVRDVFYNQIRGLHPSVDLKRQVVDPVSGALSLARKAAHRSVAANS
jgi:glucosamine kinase